MPWRPDPPLDEDSRRAGKATTTTESEDPSTIGRIAKADASHSRDEVTEGDGKVPAREKEPSEADSPLRNSATPGRSP
jgi:hypothetical protein